jgi:hypothetical protein
MKIFKCFATIAALLFASNALHASAQVPTSAPVMTQTSTQTAAPTAQALTTALLAIPRFVQSLESGVVESRANVMKKFDVLNAEEACAPTSEIAKKYRSALDNMVDTLVGRKAFGEAVTREFESLSSVERIATLKVFKAPQFFAKEGGGAKEASGPATFFDWIDGKDQSGWRDFAPEHTKEEKTAGLYAAKRAIATITRSGNEGIREQGPKHYAVHRQQMLAAIDRCIAEEEARLRR